MVDGDIALPVNDHMGFRMEQVSNSREKVVFIWKVPAEYCNSAGTLQGGVLAAFADSLLGAASAAHIPENLYPALAEMKISIFRPAPEGSELKGEGYVVKAGKRVIFAEAEIKDSNGKLIARASGTEIPAEA